MDGFLGWMYLFATPVLLAPARGVGGACDVCLCAGYSVQRQHHGAYFLPAITRVDPGGNLLGWHPQRQTAQEIITVERAESSGWLVSFELDSLDAAGMISVRLDKVGGTAGTEIRRRLPFTPSRYVVEEDGNLKRLE